MDSRLQPVAQLFTLSEGLFRKSLRDLTHDELRKSPDEHSNSMLWIAGHMAYSRCIILNLLGVTKDRPWDELFARGASRKKEPGAYPGIDEIQKMWDNVSHQLRERLENLTAAELDSPSPREMPSADKSVLGALGFFAFHETYHVGQLAYILTWLGKERLVG
jgi:uncharacterized damage-inducible protein DinB